MNYGYAELYVAERQAEWEREIEKHRLIREAEKSKASRQSYIASRLHGLGIWMIHMGKRLHKRYHVRSKACSY